MIRIQINGPTVIGKTNIVNKITKMLQKEGVFTLTISNSVYTDPEQEELILSDVGKEAAIIYENCREAN